METFANLGSSANPDINDNVDRNAYSNSSWTPPTAGLCFCFVFNRVTSGTADLPTMSGNNITWVQIATVTLSQIRLTLFGAALSGSTTGATTVDYAGVTQLGCRASFFYATGVDLSGGVSAAFVQKPTNTGTGTSGSVTLSAAANSNNRPISGFCHSANEATTERTNWTEVDDLAGSAPSNGLETQYRSDTFETTASASWTTSANWIGIAAEIKAEVAPPPYQKHTNYVWR